jgi:hypothetical protein
MNELQSYILGELSVAYYLAAGFFCFLAILISLYDHSRKRDKDSTRTPEKFSWSFLLWDNAKRIVTTLLVMFLIFRFSPVVVGKPLSMEIAVGVGFFLSLGLDKVIQLLRDKFNWFKSAQ